MASLSLVTSLSLSVGGVARIVLDATTRARVLPSLEDVITNAVLPPSEDTCHAPRRHGIISLFNTRRPHLDTLSLERSRTTNTRRRLLQTLIADITAARSDPWPKLAPPWGGPKKRLSRSADHLKSGMSTPLTSPEASTNLEPDTTPESTYLVSFVEAASSLMAAFAPALSPAYLTKAKRLSG